MAKTYTLVELWTHNPLIKLCKFSKIPLMRLLKKTLCVIGLLSMRLARGLYFLKG